MKFTAARKWAAGAVFAGALALGATQISAAAAPAPAQPGHAPTTSSTQVDYPRIGQPNLYAHDVPTLSRFYQQLGFAELFTFTLPDGTVAFATLQNGPFYLTLANFDVIKQSTGIKTIGNTFFHQFDIAILTPDVDGLVNKMKAYGARVLMAPKDQPWLERQAYIADPEGNLVQISTHSNH
jgi:lactoylglutathione lyase